MTDLFSSPVLRVEQPRRIPSAKSRYKIYDGHKNLVATASEGHVPIGRQAFRAFMGEGQDERTVRVDSAQGQPLLILAKAKTQGLKDHTGVSGPDGTPIGSIRTDRYRWTYQILDAYERQLGRLDGNRLARKFRVLDWNGAHVAQLDKKWKGAATELLTTADRYSLEIYQPLPDPLRILVAAAPIAIDLMLYEGKDWSIS